MSIALGMTIVICGTFIILYVIDCIFKALTMRRTLKRIRKTSNEIMSKAKEFKEGNGWNGK